MRVAVLAGVVASDSMIMFCDQQGRGRIGSGEMELVKGYMSRISNAARKMNDLLRDLLELPRIGRKMNTPEDVPLADLTKDVIDLVAGLA
ncbi:MAG: hypothetical protein JXM70_01440 [Pirellulales bacterium]|nr:hypothetical protein [Pirellulales bacterium]